MTWHIAINENWYRYTPVMSITWSTWEPIAQSTLESIKNQEDLVKTFTYLDVGWIDERVETITYSSATLWTSATETFAYAWSPWNYRVTSITTS